MATALMSSPSMPNYRHSGTFGGLGKSPSSSISLTCSPGFIVKSASMEHIHQEMKKEHRKSLQIPSGSRTLSSPQLASIILSRRKSFNDTDLRRKTPSPVLDSSKMFPDAPPKLVRSKSLPCISSWDFYGEESIIVSFDSRRTSMSSYTNLADHLRSLGAYDSKQPRSRGGSGAERIKQDDVIYEVRGDKNHIVYATKEKLLKSFVDPRTEMDYITQYLSTHLWHTTAGELFNKLVEIFNPGMQSNELFTTRMRVTSIIQQWKATFPEDLEVIKDKVDNFLNVIVPNSGFTPLGVEKTVLAPATHSPKPTYPKKLVDGTKHQFLDFHPTELARQLTLMEHQRFKDMQRCEFVKQGWNKKDSATRSPNIVAGIKRFNEISYWVAAEIVFCANSKQRVTVIKRMIQIANKCLGFNNFNTVMEIIAGLHMSSIQRLKKTWKALSSKYTAIFEEITKFISSEGNYRNYRVALSKVELPVNPYLGVFLRDLTFIEDGNPDFVEDDSLLNFEKMRMISGVLNQVRKYQSVPYVFEPVPMIQEYIINGTSVNLSDDALHKYSLLCEASAVSGGGTMGSMNLGKTKRMSMNLK